MGGRFFTFPLADCLKPVAGKIIFIDPVDENSVYIHVERGDGLTVFIAFLKFLRVSAAAQIVPIVHLLRAGYHAGIGHVFFKDQGIASGVFIHQKLIDLRGIAVFIIPHTRDIRPVVAFPGDHRTVVVVVAVHIILALGQRIIWLVHHRVLSRLGGELPVFLKQQALVRKALPDAFIPDHIVDFGLCVQIFDLDDGGSFPGA